jgi:hypothetical protein
MPVSNSRRVGSAWLHFMTITQTLSGAYGQVALDR